MLERTWWRNALTSREKAWAGLLLLHGACSPSAFDGFSAGSLQRDASAAESESDAAEAADDAAQGERDATDDARPGDADVAQDAAPGDTDANGQTAGDAGAPSDAGSLDGGRTEGGTPDASNTLPRDSAVDSGPPGQSSCYDRFAARAMCEGFESAQLPAPWNRAEENGTVTQAATPRPHVGIGALAARVTNTGGHAFAHRPVFPSLTSGRLFVRSYVYVPSGVALNGFIIHGLSEENEPYGGVSVLVEDSGYQLDVHPRGPGTNPVFVRSQPPVPVQRDRWLCLQLELSVHATMGAATLRVNGAVAAESTGPLATLPASGYRGVSAGIVYSDPAQAVPLQVYVDELVADTVSIPCDVAALAAGPADRETHGAR